MSSAKCSTISPTTFATFFGVDFVRRVDPQPLLRQLAGGQVDGGTLDPAAADVDAEDGGAVHGLVGHGGSLATPLRRAGGGRRAPPWQRGPPGGRRGRQPRDAQPVQGRRVSCAAGAGTRRTAPGRSWRCRRSRSRRSAGRPRSSARGRRRRAGGGVALEGDVAQPARVVGGLRVALQLEERDRADQVGQRVGVQRVRAEVAHAGDHRARRAAADERVGRAEVAVHQRGRHTPGGQVGLQPVPDVGDVGQVRLQLRPAARRRVRRAGR